MPPPSRPYPTIPVSFHSGSGGPNPCGEVVHQGGSAIAGIEVGAGPDGNVLVVSNVDWVVGRVLPLPASGSRIWTHAETEQATADQIADLEDRAILADLEAALSDPDYTVFSHATTPVFTPPGPELSEEDVQAFAREELLRYRPTLSREQIELLCKTFDKELRVLATIRSAIQHAAADLPTPCREGKTRFERNFLDEPEEA